MTIDSDEGANFLSAFHQKFAAAERTEARRKAERRAGLTPGQRARRGPPKVQLNFRATKETKALIDALADHTGSTITDVLARAVHELAQKLSVKGKTS